MLCLLLLQPLTAAGFMYYMEWQVQGYAVPQLDSLLPAGKLEDPGPAGVVHTVYEVNGSQLRTKVLVVSL